MTINGVTESGDRLGAEMSVLRACYDAGDFDGLAARAASLLRAPLQAEERFKVLLWKSCAESELGNYLEGAETLKLAGLLLDGLSGSCKAKFHGQRALFSSRRNDVDAALIDLTAARFWAQEAGDKDSEARARNNLAKQYSDAGRLDEALGEVEAAIRFAIGQDDQILLGRFYDLKAQILLDHQRYFEALESGERAVQLLGGHPAGVEARATLGRALIIAGGEHLDQEDPIASFRAKRSAVELLKAPLTKEILERALEQSRGNISTATALLGINHSAIRKAIKKYSLTHLQTRKHDRKFFKSVITVK